MEFINQCCPGKCDVVPVRGCQRSHTLGDMPPRVLFRYRGMLPLRIKGAEAGISHNGQLQRPLEAGRGNTVAGPFISQIGIRIAAPDGAYFVAESHMAVKWNAVSV